MDRARVATYPRLRYLADCCTGRPPLILTRPLFALTLLLFAGTASAGPIMDFIRSYDLNDYSLGLSIAGSESPYVGGSNSLYAYPYLTSFRDSSFTRDWFLISEGDVGLRFVTQSDWELGLVGRIQTLGPGNSTAPELRGLSDRSWTIEMAPMIGYRGWPVHINLRTYWEILDSHDGNVSQLTFSYPREFDWGFIVPSVRAIHRSSAYTNHYFGVSEQEALPGRPTFSPGASTSYDARIRWGYAIGEKWLLSGTVGFERFATEISDSPIVDKDKVWSANIGLAYNSDIFQPRESLLGDKRQPRFEFRVSAFWDSGDVKIVRDAQDGSPGDEIDLEDVLGVSENETVMQLDMIYRISDFHRLELGYFELTREGNRTLEQDIRVADTVFSAGTAVQSRFKTEILRFSYAYSLMNDAQKELGVMAGMHINNNIGEIVSPLTGELERTDISTPLPVIGLHGSVELGQHSTLGARAQVFALEFDRYDGHMIYLMLDWQRRFGNGFSAGVAYQLYATRLDSTEADVIGRLESDHHGPSIFFSANF